MPTIPDAFRHPLNNYDINFRVTLQDFDFMKTDYQIYHDPRVIEFLPGAEFRVFRTVMPTAALSLPGGILGTNVLVTPGNTFPANAFPPLGAGIWQEVYFANNDTLMASTTTAPISFTMDPRFVYQLVEVTAPAGFQLPGGQWRLTHTPNAVSVWSLNADSPQIIGHMHTPEFVQYAESYLPSHGDVMWYLGNFRPQNLPLTGGEGETAMFMAAGAGVIGVGLLVFVVVVILRKNKKDS